MPLPLLIAMILAFGLRLPSEAGPLNPADLSRRLIEAGLGVALVGLVAALFGWAIRLRSRGVRAGIPRARGLLVWALRIVGGLGLGVFAWTIAWLDWPRVVGWGLGLRDVFLIEQATVLAPFLAGQVVSWCGLYGAEAVLRPSLAERGFGTYLLRKARHSFGLLLPVAILYSLGQDLMRRGVPEGLDNPVVQFLGLCLVSTLVFLLSPAFVRLTWPTRRLERGPLRDRLERLARRLGFRYTDVLVWDTNGLVVNAGVTGAVPWFRYVLITDAMIDCLYDNEIEAVFGHEVGHVAHRHLPYFAFFCLGSMGLLTLASEGLLRAWDYRPAFAGLFPDPAVAEVVEAGLTLAMLGLYFFFVFGWLSRRFERQADVFGCRAVSCGREDCPPHLDPNEPGASEGPVAGTCRAGIAIFAEALSKVAALNGMAPSTRSWRHGSIAKRIDFLRSLEGRPDVERRFQSGVVLMRWAMGIVLAAASVGAVAIATAIF